MRDEIYCYYFEDSFFSSYYTKEINQSTKNSTITTYGLNLSVRFHGDLFYLPFIICYS